MSAPIPSIWNSLLAAHRDAARAAVAMPVASLAIFVMRLAESAVDVFGVPGIDIALEFRLLDATRTLAWSLFATPALIALYRFIILGERSDQYRIEFTARSASFFMWLILLNGLLTAATHLIETVMDEDWPILAVAIACLLAVCLLWVRLMLLFPAIAADAPGAAWRSTLADTRGYVFRMVSVVLLAAFIPIALSVVVAIAVLIEDGFVADELHANVVVFAASGIASAWISLLFIAIAAGFYRWMGRRLLEA